MKVSIQKVARKRLDAEMQPFRRAAMEKHPTSALLRTLRKAMKIYSPEIAAKIGRSSLTVFAMERREAKGKITLRDMERYANAMDCIVVYGIVPRGGRTLEELYEERLWAAVLGTEIRGEAVGQ
jgi:transcriptional regulator with XRE-family HTH domain